MELIKQIAKEIKKHNGRALLVGGYVRDKLLDRKSKDFDLEVYNMQPSKLISILESFGNVNAVGEFGVLKLNNEIDFAIPRRERKTGPGYKGFEISIDPTMTYPDACQRRDLTVNAMMLDPLTGELIDCYNGLRDLKIKTLRFVNADFFKEDPLRVLRVAQFASRLGFKVDICTTELCKSLLGELKYLSRERIFIELEKMLMKSEKPSIAFRWMLEVGVIEELFPELFVLTTEEQGKKYHPEGTVWEHTMLAIDSVPMEDRTLPIMLAVLLHDVGKPVCDSHVDENDPGHIHFHGHAECGVDVAKGFLNRITTEKALTKEVKRLIEFHMQPHQLKRNLKKKSVRRLALKVDIPALLIVHRADKHGRLDTPELSHVDDITNIYEEIKNEIKPILYGKHLIGIGMVPGVHFGPILFQVFEKQIEGELSTLDECLEYVKNNF